ncbi:DUF4145 domain-containing protein [Luteipulveratus flavus]|uniref:DUF4145 domain-containing protein n=1 Tax=Luteipulveratus flavus TaxID=3031728 RepID=A0ABT6CB23_9MICO|nr:DUF4145 domain-containing protein [Luteipulveratus sp. YIM 133296]MDF8266093.1 DUF4145 domain-containing protein [Luteipulveratus sp. YIM 133296]
MAQTTCGRCGRLAYMPAASGLHLVKHPSDFGYLQEAAYKCPNCGRLNIASEPNDGIRAVTVQRDPTNAENAAWDEPSWVPRYTDETEYRDGVPEHIATAAQEATLCLSVGAYRAVGALARAVIEATAKAKGQTSGTLEKKIDALETAKHIREHTRDQAHEIRHFGNDMAHGDFVDPVDKEEAEEIIALMSEVLDEVYQSPYRLDQRRKARAAKKAAKSGA